MLKTISNFYVVTLLFCTLTIGLILSSSHVSSASTTADAAVTVGSACTMTATVDTPHSAEVPNGTNRTEIGTTTLNTICNDSGGFAIYAVGYSNNEYGNTTMINQADSSITFNTGTATSGSNSNWSMKLSQVTTGTFATTIDNSFNNYHNVPNTYTKVAHRDSATDAVSANPATGTSISATYQTFISPTQASGTYQGKVKYTIVHPASAEEPGPKTTQANKICYYANGNDVVGTMGCQTIPDSGTTDNVSPTSAILLASNFSREGYGFAGWSTTYDYSDSTGFLGPQEYIEFEEGAYSSSDSGLSLYAHWVKSAGNIQNWSGCSSLQQGSVTALTDQRDDDTYAVAKLADGNCWMIENLRLDNTAEHNMDGLLAQGYGEQFTGLATPETYTLFNNTTTANSAYSTNGAEGTINIGTTNASYRFPRYNNLNTPTNYADRPQDPTSNSATNNVSNASMYSYGNYYTWSAAIADITNYSDNNQSITNYSICPSGWHLPTGGLAYPSDSTSGVNVTGNPSTYRESYNLGYTIMDEVKVAYEDRVNNGQSYYSRNTINNSGDTAVNAFRKYPNNFILSGLLYNGTISSRGSNGYYRTSTTTNVSQAYTIYIGKSLASPGTTIDLKYSGCAIRCTISNT